VTAFTYPKSARLLNSDAYARVFKQAELNISSGPLRLRVIQNRMPRARLGVVVSKRGNPRAVRRNRIKRIVRERFRLLHEAFPGVDMAVQVFAPIEDHDLVVRIEQLFKKVDTRFSHDA